MANTTPKNRLNDLYSSGLANVDSLFEHFFGPQAVASRTAAWRVPASVWEADDRLHLELDAPGVAKEDVDITFDKGELTITVARKRSEDCRYWHNERGYGQVTRSISLPDTVDADSLEASLTNGVLRVSVAKRPEAQPKRIELK